MDKKQKTNILETPAGKLLNAMIEANVFNRKPCLCSRVSIVDGECIHCQGTPIPAWSDSLIASAYLRGYLSKWPYQKRARFYDNLSTCLAFRLQSGAVQPKEWILHGKPEDIARAAVLTALEMPA